MEDVLDSMTDTLLATATAAATAIATATAAAEEEGWLPSEGTNSTLPLGMDGTDVTQPGGSYFVVSSDEGRVVELWGAQGLCGRRRGASSLGGRQTALWPAGDGGIQDWALGGRGRSEKRRQ